MLRSGATVNVAAGWGCSEAQGCCSAQKTPGGGTTQSHPQLSLKVKDSRGKKVTFYPFSEFNEFKLTNSLTL